MQKEGNKQEELRRKTTERKQLTEPNIGSMFQSAVCFADDHDSSKGHTRSVRQKEYLDSFLWLCHTQLSCSVNYIAGYTVTHTSHPGSLQE